MIILAPKFAANLIDMIEQNRRNSEDISSLSNAAIDVHSQQKIASYGLLRYTSEGYKMRFLKYISDFGEKA